MLKVQAHLGFGNAGTGAIAVIRDFAVPEDNSVSFDPQHPTWSPKSANDPRTKTKSNKRDLEMLTYKEK